MSAGFLEVLEAYRHFYNLGLRPSTPLECISLVIPQAQDNEAL
jgi:hypothetical protein